MIRRIQPKAVPESAAPFSQVVMDDTYAHFAGLVAADFPEGQAVLGDVGQETRVVLSAIRSMLEEIGLDMDRIVRTDVHLASLEDFDTMDSAYREFSLDYMTRVIEALPREADGRRVPVILFTKNGGQWLEYMAEAGADCLGLDWTTEIGAARARVGDKVALQGNMDPTMLYASPGAIRTEVARILEAFGSGTGHVFNLGHGITPGIDPEHVTAFVDAVVELSPQYHRD